MLFLSCRWIGLIMEEIMATGVPSGIQLPWHSGQLNTRRWQ